MGRTRYPHTEDLLIRADCGGSNGYPHANPLPQVAHYHPPFTGAVCPPLDTSSEVFRRHVVYAAVTFARRAVYFPLTL